MAASSERRVTQAVEETAKQVRRLVNTARDGFTIALVPDIVTTSMRIVDRIADLRGEDKKEVVIRVVVRLVDESDTTGALEPLVLPMIPPLIEMILSIDKGALQIKVREAAHGCFSCMKRSKGCKGGC